MKLNPADYPPLDDALFSYANNWQFNDGTRQPVPDAQYVRVMYSNGFIASKVRPAYAWQNWMAGRNWWLRPEPEDRLWIMMYCVV